MNIIRFRKWFFGLSAVLVSISTVALFIPPALTPGIDFSGGAALTVEFEERVSSADIERVLELPYAHIHLYNKGERPGRKLGHVNILADSYEELVWRVKNCAQFLPGSPEFKSSLTAKT